jgi:hypothetical protein
VVQDDKTRVKKVAKPHMTEVLELLKTFEVFKSPMYLCFCIRERQIEKSRYSVSDDNTWQNA